MQQLDARHQPDRHAHGVARDFPLASAYRRAGLIDADEHDRLDLTGAAAGLANRVRSEERHTALGQPLGLTRLPAHMRPDLDDPGDLDAVLERERRRVQPEHAGADHQQPSRGQRAIAHEQGGGAVGSERAGALPARKAQQHVARASSDDEAVEAHEPRAPVVGQPEHRRRQLLHGRAVHEPAPDVGTELHVHAGVVRGRERRVRLHHALEHRRAIADGRVHALAEAERNVHRHHVVVDRMLVDQQHLAPAPTTTSGTCWSALGALPAIERWSLIPRRPPPRPPQASRPSRRARASPAACRRSGSARARRDRRRSTARVARAR